MLALSDDALADKLDQYARALAVKTAEADAALQKEIETL
jgi:hypothetical protein